MKKGWTTTQIVAVEDKAKAREFVTWTSVTAPYEFGHQSLSEGKASVASLTRGWLRCDLVAAQKLTGMRRFWRMKPS